jgi:hypothetical protein
VKRRRENESAVDPRVEIPVERAAERGVTVLGKRTVVDHRKTDARLLQASDRPPLVGG